METEQGARLGFLAAQACKVRIQLPAVQVLQSLGLQTLGRDSVQFSHLSLLFPGFCFLRVQPASITCFISSSASRELWLVHTPPDLFK